MNAMVGAVVSTRCVCRICVYKCVCVFVLCSIQVCNIYVRCVLLSVCVCVCVISSVYEVNTVFNSFIEIPYPSIKV